MDGALEILNQTKSVSLSEVTVIGSYRRYDEQARNRLRDWRDRIVAPLVNPTRNRENFLIWAPPGTGKSFFVEETARSVPSAEYVKVNHASDSRDTVEARLSALDQSDKPSLCLIDEVDASSDQSWPYESTFPWLDLNMRPDRSAVFVLVGSSGGGLLPMIERIRSRPKGTDLVDRIQVDHRFEIPGPSLGDWIVIAISALLRSSGTREVPFAKIEKWALYYLLASPDLATSRQIELAIARASARVPSGEGRLKYRDLFHVDDVTLEEFYAAHQNAARILRATYVHIVP